MMTTNLMWSSPKTALAWASLFQPTLATWIPVMADSVANFLMLVLGGILNTFWLVSLVWGTLRYLRLSNWHGVLLPSVYSAGVIVKNIVKGSAVDQNGRIRIGDIILSVSSNSLLYILYCGIVLSSSFLVLITNNRTILCTYNIQPVY